MLFGLPVLTNKVEGKSFSFFPPNFFPDVFESYANLNRVLASFAHNAHKESQTDVLVEMAGGNGVLGTLVSELNYKRFYSIQHSSVVATNVEHNLAQNGLDEKYFKTFVKFTHAWKRHISQVLRENGAETRICFVMQGFSLEAPDYERKASKKKTIRVHCFLIKTVAVWIFNLFYSYELKIFRT